MPESKRLQRAVVLGALVAGVTVGALGAAALLAEESKETTEPYLARSGDTYARIVADQGLSCLESELSDANRAAELEVGSPVLIPPSCRSAPSVTTDSSEEVASAEPAAQGSAPSSAGLGFVESFDGNDGLAEFDFGVYHRDEGLIAVREWSADHDEATPCGDPATSRNIQRGTDAWIFVCREHLMSSIGDTSGYSTGWFGPKQTFSNVSRVSWDANITDLGGRQWWEVAIVPASFNSGVPTCPHCSVDASLSPSPAGLPAHPAGSVVVGLRYVVHADGVDHDAAMHIPKGTFDPEGFASKAIRRPFSVTDNGDGTITVDWGGVRTSTVPGSFPAGDIKVVFKDHNYTPDKDGPVAGHTWHWDSIVIR